MKSLIAISLVFLSTALIAQQPAFIEYAALSTFHWGLFKGKVNQKHLAEMGENTGAVTVSSLSYTALQISDQSADVKISARFHPDESWTRYPNLNQPEEALVHEKRHFDITEIYARKLRRLVSNSSYSSRNFKAILDRQFKDLADQHRAEQVRYDHETKNSIDPEQQEQWNAWIDAQLEALSAYSGTAVLVNLD